MECACQIDLRGSRTGDAKSSGNGVLRDLRGTPKPHNFLFCLERSATTKQFKSMNQSAGRESPLQGIEIPWKQPTLIDRYAAAIQAILANRHAERIERVSIIWQFVQCRLTLIDVIEDCIGRPLDNKLFISSDVAHPRLLVGD